MDTSIQENFETQSRRQSKPVLHLFYSSFYHTIKTKLIIFRDSELLGLSRPKIPNTFLNSILDSPSWSLYLFSLPSTFQILSLVNGWPFLIVLLNGYKCGSWCCNCSHFTTLINISNSIYQSKGPFFRYLKHVTVGQAVHHVFFWLCTWWISSSWRFFVAA